MLYTYTLMQQVLHMGCTVTINEDIYNCVVRRPYSIRLVVVTSNYMECMFFPGTLFTNCYLCYRAVMAYL